MSKARVWASIINTIMIVLCELLMIFALFKGKWMAAVIWKTNFDVWLANEVLNTLLRRMEEKEEQK